MATRDKPRWPQSREYAWRNVPVGSPVTVIKLSPKGDEAARYPAKVIARVACESWLVVRATWTHRLVELDGLTFSPGDELVEWFSPEHFFNAFAVYAANDSLKGWYANVTHPARLDFETDPPLLVWHDLYVDLVGLPDGTFTVRDEDELDDSGLEQRDRALHAHVLRARDILIHRFRRGAAPFTEVSNLPQDAG